MKKKIFAAFAAAVTGICCLAAPVSAESQYRMGDVNRDGKIGLSDVQLALKEYTAVQIGKYPLGTVLDDEQRSLAMVADRNKLKGNAEYAQDHVVIQDVYILLSYYTFYLGAEDGEKLDVAEFSEKYWYPYVHDNQ